MYDIIKTLTMLVVFLGLVVLPLASVFFGSRYIWKNITVVEQKGKIVDGQPIQFHRVLDLPTAFAFFMTKFNAVKGFFLRFIQSKDVTASTANNGFEKQQKKETKQSIETMPQAPIKTLCDTTPTEPKTSNKEDTDQELPKATKFASGDFG